ncbi:hypothetical protein FVW20_14490, partial [Desulfovibrio oxamicus]|nr:hypothetical protein [Nitratidesulfovibrio oxamicus]
MHPMQAYQNGTDAGNHVAQAGRALRAAHGADGQSGGSIGASGPECSGPECPGPEHPDQGARFRRAALWRALASAAL